MIIKSSSYLYQTINNSSNVKLMMDRVLVPETWFSGLWNIRLRLPQFYLGKINLMKISFWILDTSLGVKRYLGN